MVQPKFGHAAPTRDPFDVIRVNMKALVTGGTGFLGSHLCARLASEGWDVAVLCRASSSAEALKNLPVDKIVGDLTVSEDVDKAVKGRDAVFHAAAHLSYWGKQMDIQQAVNVAGTRNVVEACLRNDIGKLVHVSSVAAIGIPDDRDKPATEDFRFNLANLPLNYHNSKKQAEDIVLNAAGRGLNVAIVNPASIWGPHGDVYRGSEIVRKVRRSRLVPYFTGGICVVHVDDVVDGILRTFKSGRNGERYILGSENATLKDIARRAAEKQSLKVHLVPVPPAVTFASALAFESLSLVTKKRPQITFTAHLCARRFHFYDSSKAKRELGYSPRGLDQILDDCIAFTEELSRPISSEKVAVDGI